MTADVVEVEEITTVPEAPATSETKNVALQALLEQYLDIASQKGKIPTDEYEKTTRNLRRKIRDAGGSVRMLLESDPAAASANVPSAKAEKAGPAAKAPKAPKASKKSRRQNHSELREDPNAPPANKEQVQALAQILSGEIGGLYTFQQMNRDEVEKRGLYGFGLDVMADTTATLAVSKFMARFGAEPMWFAMLEPTDPTVENGTTLLILGPVPTGTPVVEEVALTSTEEAEAEGDAEGDEPGEEVEEVHHENGQSDDEVPAQTDDGGQPSTDDWGE